MAACICIGICKGCKGKTPHFYQSDQISKKLSFVLNLRVFWGWSRRAPEGPVCLYTLNTYAIMSPCICIGICKGCKGKPPHFYQLDQISKKLSFVLDLRVFWGWSRRAPEGPVCLYTINKNPCVRQCLSSTQVWHMHI